MQLLILIKLSPNLYSSKSLLGNNWKLKSFDERESLMISQRYKLSPLLAKLLNIRNVKENEIENYLNLDLNNNLPNPFDLIDMKKFH